MFTRSASWAKHGRIERGTGRLDPPEKSQKIKGFLAIWVRIPENDKETKQAFNVE